MSSTSVARFGAPAALTAAVCFVAFDVPHFFLGHDVRESAGEPLFLFHALAGLVGLLALVVVVLALKDVVEQRTEHPGHAGFGLALAGTVLAAGGAWGEAFLVPVLRDASHAVLERPEGTFLAGLLLTIVTFAVGWVLVARTLRRTGVLSRRGAVVVAAGAVASSLPLPGGVLLFVPGMLLLGLRLRHRTPVARPLQDAAVARSIAA